MTVAHSLSCHCGNIRIEVDAELDDLHECNCSTCARHGFIHWKVQTEAVRVIAQKRDLSVYVWRDENCGHHFCPSCGTAIFRTGYRGCISVNARCLENVDVFELNVRRYDGRREMP